MERPVTQLKDILANTALNQLLSLEEAIHIGGDSLDKRDPALLPNSQSMRLFVFLHARVLCEMLEFCDSRKI